MAPRTAWSRGSLLIVAVFDIGNTKQWKTKEGVACHLPGDFYNKDRNRDLLCCHFLLPLMFFFLLEGKMRKHSVAVLT